MKKILRELRSEEDLAKVEESVRILLRNIDPVTLSLAEQELMEEGFDPEAFRRLCEIHLRAITIKEEGSEIGRNHPIGILKAEHEVILNNLKVLERIAKKVGSHTSLEKLSEELKELEPVVELLIDAESHHQREERVLFPRLEELGITGPPSVMRVEHEDLRVRKKALKKLLDERETLDSVSLADKMRELGDYIVSTLGDHIYKENNILYPLALRTIPENEWCRIKEEFDAIGYCCFTPGIEAREGHTDSRT